MYTESLTFKLCLDVITQTCETNQKRSKLEKVFDVVGFLLLDENQTFTKVRKRLNRDYPCVSHWSAPCTKELNHLMEHIHLFPSITSYAHQNRTFEQELTITFPVNNHMHTRIERLNRDYPSVSQWNVLCTRELSDSIETIHLSPSRAFYAQKIVRLNIDYPSVSH